VEAAPDESSNQQKERLVLDVQREEKRAAAGEIARVEQYLHDHIPLSKAMEIRVLDADQEGVRLTAPLAPNINHQSTAFGGSVSAVAILSAWTLLHLRLRDFTDPQRIVIQRNSMEYLLPIEGDITARCGTPSDAEWKRFFDLLRKRGRARIELSAEVFAGEQLAGRFEGSYVVLR
jgi:thioesterase domain-containing protein